MSRPLRVAVLDHSAQLSGAELALLRLCGALDPARVQAEVVLLSDGPLVGALREQGVTVHVLPMPERVARTSRSEVPSGGGLAAVRAAVSTLPTVVRLARLLRGLDVDVLHTTSLKADLLGLPAAALARVPLVWHVHDRIADDYLPGVVVRGLRLLARLPRHVVANSRATALTLGRLPRGVTVVHPGLTPAQSVLREAAAVAASGAPGAAAAPAPPAPRVVGMLGRISPTKGQLELLRACALLPDRHRDVRVRIVGSVLFEEADYAARIDALVAELGLTDRVELTGFAADPSVELDRMSLLVHASPVPEPFGQVVAEAMARGVPVVATAAGGVPEIVAPDGVEPLGLLVPPGDVAALARAITEVLDDEAGAAARALRARADVVRRFSIERTAARLTGVWERVAGREPGPPAPA